MTDINKLDVIVGRFISASDEARNTFIDELRADNARLRAALQEIASGCANPMFVARAAMEPKP